MAHTKKQYEEVADVIQGLSRWDSYLHRGVEVVAVAYIVDSFVKVFTEDNSRFDKTRFLAACHG